MKKDLLWVSIVALLPIFATDSVSAQERANHEVRASPNAGVSQTIGMTIVNVGYGRPGVKGRKVFGELQKFGDVWRAGANEATTISISEDVKIEGQSLAAGTYSFYLIPFENDAWTVIINNHVDWGMQYHEDEDVLRFSVTPQPGPKQEWLQYRFEDLSRTSATLIMHWDTVVLPIRIEIM